MLSSSRYFEMVGLLPCYDGAVRAGLRRLMAEQEDSARRAPADTTPARAMSGPPIPGLPAGARVIHLDDARAAAAMTKNALGMPSVGYKGGG